MTEKLNATFGTFMSTRLDMRLAGDWSDFQRDTAKAGPLATYVHEHMHFFQTIFTGYGQIQWDLHRQYTSYTFSEWKKLLPAMNTVRLPLANCGVTPRLEVESRHIYEAVAEQIRISTARFSMRYPTMTLKEHGCLLLNFDWRANPVVEVNGQQRALQTKDILEGHAHFVERTFLERVGGFSFEAAWSRDALHDQYTAAYDWFIERCGEERREEFPVICDLALQTSLTPLVPTNEEEWQRSNPSWRFILLTDALVKHPGLKLGEPANWPSTYSDFCKEVLSICGFVQLQDIYDERLESLNRVLPLMSVQQLMKDAIEYRRLKPWCSANPPLDLPGMYYLFENFKAPFVVVGDKPGSFGAAAVPGAEVVFELHFQAFAAQLFGDYSRIAQENNLLECGLGKYQIPNICSFQSTHGCLGRFNPNNGIPHEMWKDAQDTLEGCSFGWFLTVAGIDVNALDMDTSKKFAPIRDLTL